MIELLSEEKIKSCDYLKIQHEFQQIWNKLFISKNKIDSIIFNRFGRFWPATKALSISRFQKNPILPQFEKIPLNSELVLHSNQLWMTRAWEYPWAIMNSHLTKESKVLDIGSGWSLFPLYLAQKSEHVDSVDGSEFQMRILSPALADIVQAKVNYIVGDALKLTAHDNTYDDVYCISVLEHLEEEVVNGVPTNRHRQKLDRTAIRELLRVVKPGGRVILTLDYGDKELNPASFHVEYTQDLILEFESNLLSPAHRLDDINYTREVAQTTKRLWSEYFPYEKASPRGTSLGIVLTK